MPVFEYKCTECDSRFEVLHKSVNNIEKVECPECHSNKINKLLSAFSAAGFTKNASDIPSYDSCETGSCGCGSGYCGLN